MLKNTVQILVAFGLLATAVCPCLAQTLLVEEDSHHAHASGHHHADANSLPECHGGDSEAACIGASATMGDIADAIVGNNIQFDDDEAADVAEFDSYQPDLTHHGGSPPTAQILVAGSPVTLGDRLIE